MLGPSLLLLIETHSLAKCRVTVPPLPPPNHPPHPPRQRQVLGIVVIGGWSCTLSALLFGLLKKVRACPSPAGLLFVCTRSASLAALLGKKHVLERSGPAGRWRCPALAALGSFPACVEAPIRPASHPATPLASLNASAFVANPCHNPDAPPCCVLQLNWLRVPKDDELQGLDYAQGIGSGIRGGCFPCLPCCQS